jgi:hypothetical protein
VSQNKTWEALPASRPIYPNLQETQLLDAQHWSQEWLCISLLSYYDAPFFSVCSGSLCCCCCCCCCFAHRFLRCFHSALATFIKRSSSLTGIQLVNTFMAFSKSESSKMSRVASISAADVACSTSKSAPKLLLAGSHDCEESPRSMKTSQTRS